MLKNNTKKILIAIGSNLSNDLQESYDLVSDAIKTFNSETINDIKISKFYETPAFPPGSGPNFINCAISGNTSLLPKELFASIVSQSLLFLSFIIATFLPIIVLKVKKF